MRQTNPTETPRAASQKEKATVLEVKGLGHE
jgi:hypothetical protein